MPSIQPSKIEVVKSLKDAADAAQLACEAAQAANPAADPSGDLSKLYKAEMKAAAMWSTAEKQAFNADPAVAAAQAALDAATKDIRNQLGTLKDIAQWVKALDELVNLATTVSKFFV